MSQNSKCISYYWVAQTGSNDVCRRTSIVTSVNWVREPDKKTQNRKGIAYIRSGVGVCNSPETETSAVETAVGTGTARAISGREVMKHT
jgi:hypothetical protein